MYGWILLFIKELILNTSYYCQNTSSNKQFTDQIANVLNHRNFTAIVLQQRIPFVCSIKTRSKNKGILNYTHSRKDQCSKRIMLKAGFGLIAKDIAEEIFTHSYLIKFEKNTANSSGTVRATAAWNLNMWNVPAATKRSNVQSTSKNRWKTLNPE